MPTVDGLDIAITFAIALPLLITIILLVILYKVARWGLRLLRALLVGNVFVFVNIGSFAIAFFLLPDVVIDIANNFVGALRVLVDGVRSMVASLPQTVEPCQADNSVASCLAIMSYSFTEHLRRIVFDPLQYFFQGSLSLTNLVYFVLIWTLVVSAIMLPFDARVGRVMSGFSERLQSAQASTTKRKNILLLLILGSAGYLSFTAIAALPGLRVEESPEEVSVEKLKTTLEQFKTTELATELDTRLLPSVIAPEVIWKPVSQSEMTDNLFSQFLESTKAGHDQWMDEQVRRTENLESLWKRMRDEFGGHQDRLLDVGLQRYETENLRRFGFKETVAHFQDITEWYTSQMAKARDAQEHCRGWLINYAKQRDEVNKQISVAVTMVGPEGAQGASVSSSALPDMLGVTRAASAAAEAYYTALERCQFEWMVVPPERQTTGTETLGVIGDAAGWLLETESVPIVLVVGMLGFGLLGASFSTFVRERPLRKPGDPLVEDLAGVVIRGISAAIVVFLGIYGGLSVMTASAEPDPYLVFFICLVGAVFSDVVWEWAQGRLRLQLGEDEAVQRRYTVEELSPEKSFYFRGPLDRFNLRAGNLRQFVRVADGVDNETWAHHLRNGDYARWFRDTVMDGVLADEVAGSEGAELDPAESRAKVRQAIGRRYPEAVN